jgi:DNA polymerase III subunit delta
VADDVFAALASGKPAPVYVLSSEQPLLLERAVNAIRDATVPPALRGFNYDVYDVSGAGRATASRILATAQTLPMMAQRRMVLVRDIGAMQAAELNKLVEYLESPNPSTVLVAVAGKVDKRVKFFATAVKRKLLHELAPPRELTGWIKSEAGTRRIAIAPDACARLADVVGKDLARVALALDQLALYAGDRTIEAEDVDDLVADTRERSVFELTDAIGKGDIAAALAAVAALCEQRQSAIGVVVMVARFMRQLALCQVAQARRLPKEQAAQLVGAPPFAVQKLMSQARRYDQPGLARAARRLTEADQSLKGMDDTIKILGRQLGERVVLDRLVTELIGLGGRP